LLVSRPWEIKKYIKNAASSQLLGKKIGFSLSAKPTYLPCSLPLETHFLFMKQKGMGCLSSTQKLSQMCMN
jgi:hypothetical protein